MGLLGCGHRPVTPDIRWVRLPYASPLYKYMTNTLKHLVDLFVDETPLSAAEFETLIQNGLIDEVELGAWQLTQKGKALLKNST